MKNTKLLMILILLSIISLQACDSKSSKGENPLYGKWLSDNKIMRITNSNYEEILLEFGPDFMKIGDKKIPVIYKVKKSEVVMFSRGERVTAYMQSENKMVLFLRNLGKRPYIRQD